MDLWSRFLVASIGEKKMAKKKLFKKKFSEEEDSDFSMD